MEELYEWTHKVKNKENGRLETKKAFEYRQWWQNEGCPPLQKVADNFKTTRKNIDDNYCKKYGWFEIRDKKQEFDAINYSEKLKKDQKDTIVSLQKLNEDRLNILKSRRNHLLISIGSIPNPVTNQYEIDESINVENAWKEIYEIDKRISQVQKDLLSAYRLPERINDKHEFKGEIDTNGKMKVSITKTIKDLEEEYEDYYKELQSELEGNQKDNNNHNTGE